MATSGSSSRAASGSRSFDFGSDDDYAGPDPSSGKRADPAEKDFRDSRMGRPSVHIYEQGGYMKDDALPAVEKCMKKYADTLLRSLEGIGGRLSQLEIHCYKLERSVGEFRSDIIRDQSEVGQKLKSLEEHLQEVHRSLQNVRDKQKLADAQKELAKFQIEHEETTKKNKEDTASAVSETKKLEVSNQQLALVSPHQANTPPVPRASEPVHPYTNQTMQRPVPTSPSVQYQSSAYYSQSELQYLQAKTPVLQNRSVQAPPQLPQIINQTQATQPQPFPQYQQQLFQHPTLQFQPQVLQQPTSQQPQLSQIRPQAPSSYSPYPPHQSANPAPGTFSASMPIQGSYAAIPQAVANRPEVVPYAYGGPGIAAPQQPPPPQQNAQQRNVGAAPYTQPVNVQGYSPAYGYLPNNVSAIPGTQLMRSHPFGEMIERAVGMGYARDQILIVIQRMSESGQPVDFNALLDRLNELGSGVPARAW